MRSACKLHQAIKDGRRSRVARLPSAGRSDQVRDAELDQPDDDEENEQSAEGPTHRVGQERHGLIVGSAPPFSQAFLPEITEQTGPLASPTS